MNQLSSYLPLVESDLKKRLEGLPSDASGLYEPIRYFLSLGGKRIRPVLLLSAHKLFNPDIENSLHLASSVELFHNFTLVHDDIMDNAPLRRGKPTVHEKWDISTGILSGDAMFVVVYDWLFSGEAYNPAIVNLFNEGALKVCEGQQFDMQFQKMESVSLEQYMEMVGMKTGWLLGTSMAIGALNGGASLESARALRSYGIVQGQAFQVMDDLLDVYGNESFGKKPGGDIEEGKKTWLLLQALEIAPEETRKALSIKSVEEKVTAIKKIYQEKNIRRLAEAEIAGLNAKAKLILSEVTANNEAKAELEDIFTSLASRAL